jgi:hypothetical protein
VAHGWGCATETKSPVFKELVVGDFLTRWFPTHKLPKQFVNTEGLRGAYVDAIVLEVETKKEKNSYKCAFDAPVSRDIFYGEADADMYRKRYLDRKAPSLQDEVVKHTTQNTLCKGALQRATVAESCGVVSRSQHLPKVVIKGTQDDVDNAEEKSISETVFMTRAFKEFFNQATIDDVGEENSAEDDVLSPTSPVAKEEEFAATPTALYIREQKSLRARLFPCKVCAEPADGAHASVWHLFCTCICNMCTSFTWFA